MENNTSDLQPEEQQPTSIDEAMAEIARMHANGEVPSPKLYEYVRNGVRAFDDSF